MAETGTATEQVSARIERQAAAAAEANVYSLNNPYLTTYEKACVETWAQFPDGVFGVTLLGLLASKHGWWPAVGIAATVALVVAILLRFWFPLNILRPLSFVFCGNGEALVSIAFAVYFGVSGQWWYTALAIVNAIGLLAVVSPGLWFNSWENAIAGRRMHYKYAFAKRQFKVVFPFEPFL